MSRRLSKNLVLNTLAVFSSFAFCGYAKAGNNIEITKGSSMTTFPELVERLLNNYINFVGIAAFVAIAVGGFTYLMAGANTQRAERAKKIILYAIIGMILAVLSYGLFVISVEMINDIF